MRNLSLLLSISTFTLIFSMQSIAVEPTQSSFTDVWNVVTDVDFIPRNAIEKNEFSVYQSGKNPTYPVNSTSLFSNQSKQLEKDAQRTINKNEDYYDRMTKLLHPNGVCIAGVWTATKDSPYTGYFQNGKSGLFIGRVSTPMDSVMAGERRGFGIAGKIFPTMDTHQKVKTANFFSVDVLLGTDARRMLDVRMTNEPEIGFTFSLIGLGLKIASALKTADENPAFRPLYPISQLGLTQGEISRTPRWFRISADISTIKNNERDFRNEILRAVEENSKLVFNVDVSDSSKDKDNNSAWKTIAQIVIDRASLSYGCDRRLHFAHPKLNP
jgi:hypothetical protein